MRILTTLLLMLVTALPGLAATTYPAGTNVANTFFQTNTFKSNTVFQTTLQINDSVRPGVSPTNTAYIWLEDNNGLPAIRIRDSMGLVLGMVRDDVWIAQCAIPGGIKKGEAVYVAGVASTNAIWVGKARANDRATMACVGLAAENIAYSKYGRIMNNGLLVGVNTTNWASGEVLYVSDSVDGGLTNVLPLVPNYMQQVGMVQINDETNGSIQIQLGSLLNEASGTSQTNWYFGPYGTNILSASGSKINGVGLTNKSVWASYVVSGTNYTDRVEATNSASLDLFGGGVNLQLISSSVQADSGGFKGPGHQLTGVKAEMATNAVNATNFWGVLSNTNMPDPLIVDELDVGTLVVTNPINGLTFTNSTFRGTSVTLDTFNMEGAVRIWDGSLIATNMTARTNDPSANALTTYGNIQVNGTVSATSLVVANHFLTNSLSFSVDGSGSAIVAGNKGGVLVVPYNCTIRNVILSGTPAGNATVDIYWTNWAGLIGGNLPVLSIVGGGTKPSLSSATCSSNTVVGWGLTNLLKGDGLVFNVSSPATLTNLNGYIWVTH